MGLIITEQKDTRNLTPLQIAKEINYAQQKILLTCSGARKTLEREHNLGRIANYASIIENLNAIENHLLYEFASLCMQVKIMALSTETHK